MQMPYNNVNTSSVRGTSRRIWQEKLWTVHNTNSTMYITTATAADSVTLFTIKLLEDFHLSEIVGGIRLGEGKEIYCPLRSRGVA